MCMPLSELWDKTRPSTPRAYQLHLTHELQAFMKPIRQISPSSACRGPLHPAAIPCRYSGTSSTTASRHRRPVLLRDPERHLRPAHLQNRLRGRRLQRDDLAGLAPQCALQVQPVSPCRQEATLLMSIFVRSPPRRHLMDRYP